MMMVQNVNSRSIHVYVLTISRFMLHRAAAAKASNFWPLIFALYDGGSLVDLALVSLLSHVYSYSICCMSESMFSAYTKKKKNIFHMALLLSLAYAMNEDVCPPHKQTCLRWKKIVFYWLSKSNVQSCRQANSN